MNGSPPDYVVIGHVAKDVHGDSFSVGGTVTFAALTACRLGRTVGVITSASPEVPAAERLACAQVVLQPAPRSTTFENIYHERGRTQRLLGQGAPLSAELVPLAWRHAPIVHLGPLAAELDERIAGIFPHSMLVVTPQGWMRRWDEDLVVRYRRWRPQPDWLARLDALVFSEEDVAEDPEIVPWLTRAARLVVVTRGAKGASLFQGKRRTDLPAVPAREVDPTGAGDVFAAAFAIRLGETGDPIEAGRFANCVASFSVERHGADGIPSLEAVRARLAAIAARER